MQLRRDEMAIRNMMQMKQAGFDAKLRDTVDDAYLTFDYAEPDPQEVAAQEAAQAEQQQGQEVQKASLGEYDIFKRDVNDPIHGSVRPAREGGAKQTRSSVKGNAGDRVIHNEGSPISSKGNKNTDDPPALRRANAKLKRLNIDGQRGPDKDKS